MTLRASKSPTVRRLCRDSVARMAARVLAACNAATVEECREGLRWYLAAHAVAVELADAGGISLDAAAGILAALSPSVPWERNVEDARALVEERPRYSFSTYGPNVEKARRILAGESPCDVLGGTKVRAFYALVRNPLAQDGTVCVDRHALAVAYARPLEDAERSLVSKRPAIYARVAAAYQRAAESLGIRPHEAQAIAWVYWRNRLT